ncbi:MAG TPA: phage tail protein, partial [Haliscomenobacter sp.]|nr:phage tail protein [Haliscomenobacter sp.]
WNGTDQGLNPERRDVVINLLNPKGQPVMSWSVVNAFPTKLTSTDLNAQNNEVAIETLVLAHEGITMIEIKPS